MSTNANPPRRQSGATVEKPKLGCRSGILIIGHLAGPSIDELTELASSLELRSFILTSPPLNASQERLEYLRENSSWLRVTDSPFVLYDDLERAIENLNELSWTVAATITIFEHYRPLMAAANNMLKIPDLSAAAVHGLFNKLAVRLILRESGLSQTFAELLSENNLTSYALAGVAKFIKPIRGIASFATTALRASTTWEMLQFLADQAISDPVFSAMFADRPQFMIEDYIKGTEASIEVLVIDREVFVLAVHEKLVVAEREASMYEEVFASPPWTISQGQIALCVVWVRKLIDALKIDHGCFNLDAKVDGDRWELLEINPRLGGFLVSESVGFLTGSMSMLELWLRALIDSGKTKTMARTLTIPDDGSINAAKETYFRVYFAEPGTISNIETPQLTYQPSMTLVNCTVGEEVKQKYREETAAQVLWAYPPQRREAMRAFLELESHGAVLIQYFQAPSSSPLINDQSPIEFQPS